MWKRDGVGGDGSFVNFIFSGHPKPEPVRWNALDRLCFVTSSNNTYHDPLVRAHYISIT